MRTEIKTSLPDTGRPLTEKHVLFRYCTNCGSDAFAVWNVTYSEKELQKGDRKEQNESWLVMKKEEKEYRAMACPVCGAPAGESIFSLASETINERLRLKNRVNLSGTPAFWFEVDKLLDREKREAERRAEEKRRELDIPAESSGIASAGTIGSDPERCREYLRVLLQMEKHVYALTQRLGVLYDQQKRIGKILNREKGAYVKEARDTLAAAEAALEQSQQGSVSLERPKRPNLPQRKGFGLFGRKKETPEEKAAMARYYQELSEYRQQMENRQAEEERLTAEAVSLAENRVREAEREYQLRIAGAAEAAAPVAALRKDAEQEAVHAEHCLSEMLNTRNKLCGSGVIREKYRDLLSVVLLYEYFVTGRCTSLEGAGGAYSLCESELGSTIAPRLSVVMQQLEKYRETHSVVCRELSEVNQSLTRLNDAMENAVGALDQENRGDGKAEQTAYRTTADAFYANKNRELSEALLYLVTLS